MFTTYAQAYEYLLGNLPMYQRVGASAYKKDLTNTLKLCEALGHPQHKFKSIHVAGTNGKGSTSHMLASILQAAGYRVGLYTSPHLKRFTERIKINGQEVSESFVLSFVNVLKPVMDEIQPSFFEITVAMAFDYFARFRVDYAVIEVGLGGRLDSTNVITPELSLITNISFDHMDLLGNTLEKIAGEKAGIIKPQVPVVISETQVESRVVFEMKANALQSPIYFADQNYTCTLTRSECTVFHRGEPHIHISGFPLVGAYQSRNVAGVCMAMDVLKQQGVVLNTRHIQEGLAMVVSQTGLKGRWQTLHTGPLVVCDTAHNEAGIAEVMAQVKQQPYRKLFIVWGMVRDKDKDRIWPLLPTEALYFFCEPKIPRAQPAAALAEEAAAFGLTGEIVEDVNRALEQARHRASPEDFIFVGGSTFVVAELNEL
jgi:dihydrofolate synthase/folylpolyglutamate synthase